MRNTPLAPPSVAPLIEWPSDESRQTVILSHQDKYSRHAAAAQQSGSEAQRLASEAGALARETADAKKRWEEFQRETADAEQRWEEFQRRLDDTFARQRAADNNARIQWESAQAFAAVLTLLGGQVPSPADPQPLATPQGDVAGHAAQYGGPQQPFPDDVPHGRCLNCGQDAWRKPTSPHHPKGATHSFGATCDPNAEEMTYADLGPVRAEAVS